MRGLAVTRVTAPLLCACVGQVAEMPPRGHYLAHEVGQLAGVSGQKIGQWARRGYIRSSQSPKTPRVYSYQDVAEAILVHELLELDVPHREVLSAIHGLRAEHGARWPLQHTELLVTRPAPDSARRRAHLIVQDGDRYVRPAVSRDQNTMNFDLALVRKNLQRGGWAARNLPDLEHIEVDPDRLSGRPTIRGHRVAAEDVARLAKTEDGIETLHDGYGLTDDEIADARRWWAAVQEYEAAA